MTFAFPIAFLALLAVPGLVAIYWLRSRHRRQPVSTLMLWRDQRETREGGLLLHRMQTPLLFFLELLTILFLILAAAGPVITAGPGSRSLVVVLDDSFSMLAGSNNSPRSRALEAIAGETHSSRYRSVRLVVAGQTPQLLGEGSGDLNHTLRNEWKCLSSAANLDEAIAFAFALGQNHARILVVTDRAPETVPTDGRLEWRAFGTPRRNVAFVNATRSLRDDQERCLLEIANLSPDIAKPVLVVISGGESADDSPALRRSTLEIGPNETRRVLLKLRTGEKQLIATIDNDDLEIDNSLVLLPEAKRQVRVELRLETDAIRSLVERALSGIEGVVITSTDPDLVLTDQSEDRDVAPQAWVLRFASDGNAQSYLGPFVLDRTHPLAGGLSLEGVVWGGGGASATAGKPVITAGNIALLTDVERSDGRHDLQLRLRPDLSTLQNTPNWPILIWNLIDWRRASTPGLSQANLRLGDEAILTVGPETDTVKMRGPDDRIYTFSRAFSSPSLQGRDVRLKAESPGVYEVAAGNERYSFAANALRQQESDLTRCASGHWGEWQSAGLQVEERNIGWVLLLLASLVFAIHLAMTARGTRSSAR